MIKDTLKSAISSLSKKHQIHTSELRIRISKKEDSLKYEIMKNKDILDETNLATALNLNTITAFMVGNKLNTIIDSLSKNYQVSLSTINVRIYTKTEDCSPLLYLFDGVTPKLPLNLDDII
jgi:hypothetical protein